MKNLQLDNTTALKMYPGTIPEMKAILEQSFGKEFFSGKITDRVKTFEDALAIAGLEETDVFHEDDTVDEISYKKVKLIIRVLNEGWKPDFTNENEPKYYIWWKFVKGKGFVSYACGCYYALSHVGSRLCFRSRELAEHAAKHFEKEFNQFIN
jgi:hypothetical protein